MPSLTFHRSDRSDEPDDHVIRYNGKDVGRCFPRTMSNLQPMWGWVIFMTREGQPIPPGTKTAGYEPTQEKAKEQFRKNYDHLLAAGVVKLPG